MNRAVYLPKYYNIETLVCGIREQAKATATPKEIKTLERAKLGIGMVYRLGARGDRSLGNDDYYSRTHDP